jgi:hypothetical protein
MAENGRGRPRIIKTPEEFDAKVEAFRQLCEERGDPVTFTGMAVYLGFADRRSFYDYAKEPGFSLSVKRAQSLVETEYEKRLAGNNVAGSIFALKNHGWSDRQDLAVGGTEDGLPILIVKREE